MKCHITLDHQLENVLKQIAVSYRFPVLVLIARTCGFRLKAR